MQKYSKKLSELDIAAHLVYKTHAKQFSTNFTAKKKKSNRLEKKQQQQQQQKQPRGRSVTKEKISKPKVDESKKKTDEDTSRKTGLSIDDVKKLDNLYLKEPASIGNAKRLHNFRKIKMDLETKLSFTKYCLRRFRFPWLKVIVNDLNEIFSLDLAFVDNELAMYNSGIKYVLVAVNCLSIYLIFEPLKTKYATETAAAFKKTIKHKQPQKVCVNDVTEFLGAFKALCNKRGIHLYSTFSGKKSAFAEKNIRSLMKTKYRYLEEK